MITRESIIERYQDDTFIFFDNLDDCLIGVAENNGEYVTVYSFNKLIEHFNKEFGNYEDALEWVEYNVVGTKLSEHCPIIIYDNMEE